MRILHVTSELDGGGIERLLYDYCSRLSNTIEFDFAINSEREGILEKPLRELGSNIYRIPKLRDGLNCYCKQLSYILKNGKYDIIHVHSAYKAFIPLLIAKKSGIKVRIAHSHIFNVPESTKEKIIRILLALLTKHYATDLFACGTDAGRWVWGEKTCFYVMKNAINVDKFIFNSAKREEIRNNFNISDKIVIGNVARFSYQKNHEFLINVFAYLLRLCPEAILMLVGQGELEEDVTIQIKQLGIQNSVIMLGVRNDVEDLLNAMDIFVLPSHFEGLPVTFVEVQANGLTTIGSTNITKEICINDNVYYYSLSSGYEYWAQKISEIHTNREKVDKKTFPYNIEESSIKLKKKYEELVKNAKY